MADALIQTVLEKYTLVSNRILVNKHQYFFKKSCNSLKVYMDRERGGEIEYIVSILLKSKNNVRKIKSKMLIIHDSDLSDEQQ